MILPRSDAVQVAALDETHYRPRMSLTYQSRSAVFWSGADVFMRQGLQFFVLILLARSQRLLALEKRYLASGGR